MIALLNHNKRCQFKRIDRFINFGTVSSLECLCPTVQICDNRQTDNRFSDECRVNVEHHAKLSAISLVFSLLVAQCFQLYPFKLVLVSDSLHLWAILTSLTPSQIHLTPLVSQRQSSLDLGQRFVASLVHTYFSHVLPNPFNSPGTAKAVILRLSSAIRCIFGPYLLLPRLPQSI